EWVHVQLHQQKGMISLSPPTICNSARDAADTNVQTGQNNLQSAKSVAQLTSALSELAKQFWEKRG
ncbi:hypothetical protein P4I60_24880, partial [Escherichia coli]